MEFANLLAGSGHDSCLPCCCWNPMHAWKNMQAICARLSLFCFVHALLCGGFIPQNIGSHGPPGASSLLPFQLPFRQAGAGQQHGQPTSKSQTLCLGAMRLFLPLSHFRVCGAPTSAAGDGCPVPGGSGTGSQRGQSSHSTFEVGQRLLLT